MKTLLLAGLALAVPLAAPAAVETYDIDSGHTFPSFAIGHMGYSTHTGRFNETSGQFVIDREGEGSRVEVVIKTASADTGDPRLEEKLRSEDFFHSEKFPEMRYRSTRVTWTGAATADIEGELTLLGVTRPVPLKITRSHCATHPYFKTWWCGFAVEGSLKRSEFGMKAGIPMVADEVRISIQAEGGRKSEAAGPKR